QRSLEIYSGGLEGIAHRHRQRHTTGSLLIGQQVAVTLASLPQLCIACILMLLLTECPPQCSPHRMGSKCLVRNHLFNTAPGLVYRCSIAIIFAKPGQGLVLTIGKYHYLAPAVVPDCRLLQWVLCFYHQGIPAPRRQRRLRKIGRASVGNACS